MRGYSPLSTKKYWSLPFKFFPLVLMQVNNCSVLVNFETHSMFAWDLIFKFAKFIFRLGYFIEEWGVWSGSCLKRYAFESNCLEFQYDYNKKIRILKGHILRWNFENTLNDTSQNDIFVRLELWILKKKRIRPIQVRQFRHVKCPPKDVPKRVCKIVIMINLKEFMSNKLA